MKWRKLFLAELHPTGGWLRLIKRCMDPPEFRMSPVYNGVFLFALAESVHKPLELS